MRYGMSTLIVTGLLIIAAIALALSIFISLHKFSSAYQSAIDDRFYFAMGEAAKPLEAEMQLGQPIDKLNNAQKIIEQLKSIDPDIISVELFDTKGRTIYSTDNSYLFGLIPDSWELAARTSPKAEWQVKTDQANTLGLKLTNSLNQTVGSLVLLYSPAIEERTSDKIKTTLFKYALWLGGGAALILSFVIYSICRGLKTHLSDLENDLKDETTQKGSAFEFITACKKAQSDFDLLEEKLHKIDEGQL